MAERFEIRPERDAAAIAEVVAAYCPRFGFERASALNFVSPNPNIPDEALMVKRLRGYRPDLAGRIVYPAAFEALGTRDPIRSPLHLEAAFISGSGRVACASAPACRLVSPGREATKEAPMPSIHQQTSPERSGSGYARWIAIAAVVVAVAVGIVLLAVYGAGGGSAGY